MDSGCEINKVLSSEEKCCKLGLIRKYRYFKFANALEYKLGKNTAMFTAYKNPLIKVCEWDYIEYRIINVFKYYKEISKTEYSLTKIVK